MPEINYDTTSKMERGFPRIRKLGAVSPYGEMTPFVHGGRLRRLELVDTTRGLDPFDPTIRAIVRDVETGAILSSFGQGCYYFSGFCEGDCFYALGVKSQLPRYCGDTVMIFETTDLVNWSSRELFSLAGWDFFNTSLCRGDDGYILTLEAGAPAEAVGDHPFTCFFARSTDLVQWDFLGPDRGYPKDRYIGGPYMRYHHGYYYLFGVTELPCQRYTNYLCRTKDFDTWEVGKYNPFLMPSEEDRLISPRAADLDEPMLEMIRHGFISNNSDVDMCEWQGKTYINYAVGDQRGFYYMAEAEYDGPVGELLENFFE